MSKKRSTHFVCQECGDSSSKWLGQCPSCQTWNSYVEEAIEKVQANFSKIEQNSNKKTSSLQFCDLKKDIEEVPRINTNFKELDHVLGGGLVGGSAILIGGDPGIGKSTILIQLAAFLAENYKCAYISGEESISQISLRASRIGILESKIRMLAATNLSSIISAIESESEKFDVIVIDSIQTMYIDAIPSAPGTVAQVRACAHEIVRVGKERNIIMILVGHVTKDGQIAGPKVLEHMVDTVLYFEGERGHNFRILRAVKNRFGGINEIGVFEMTDLGLKEVSNPSGIFLSERSLESPGSAIFGGIEGTRPVLLEIQALVAPTFMATPRRAVVGWDQNRLAMIIAVLAARYKINLTDKEVYLNIAGGLKVTEPAADLAVAAALISANSNIVIPHDIIFFGEVGLSGEVRKVVQSESRIKESIKMGFEKIVTSGAKQGDNMISISKLDQLAVLISNFGHK
jgi:DNA repair protein RadA/Sms